MESITERERERERYTGRDDKIHRLEMVRQNTQRENRDGGTSSQGGSVYISIVSRLSHITERIHMPTTLANTDTQRVRSISDGEGERGWGRVTSSQGRVSRSSVPKVL